ncbi:hypothetical protein B0H98_105119 [Vreelandella songnenensis]|uniref:Uncharacterized protein n=1 Tax=Vreelandella songnenensis TaxID=1176243 RepID=A0A2T0V319_9GAMM|nr:hypothetical protein B0H98_105119 [Halomonas songnenensis]
MFSPAETTSWPASTLRILEGIYFSSLNVLLINNLKELFKLSQKSRMHLIRKC